MQFFSTIIKTLLTKHGAATLEQPILKALLSDIAEGEYQNECRLFLHLVENGFCKIIHTMPPKEELPVMLQYLARELRETYFITNEEAERMSSVMLLCVSHLCRKCENPANCFAQAGDTYYANGEYNKAISEYTTAMLIGGEEKSVFNNRGLSYYSIGEYSKAISDFDTALCIDSVYAYAYYNRGNAYYKQEIYEKAFADFNRAIKLQPKPDRAAPLSGRGLIYHARFEYDKAIADHNAAIAIRPDFAYAYSNRAISYAKKNEYDKAITDFCTAIELMPDYADAYYKRGVVYELMGKMKNAKADFETAHTLKRSRDE
jgi:tetratricopeptide (TPR) repeat protein